MDEQIKYAPLHKTANEQTSSEAGTGPAILEISNKTYGDEFHRRITRVALSNSFSKDKVNSQPQTQKKGIGLPSLIQATGIELLMHEVDCRLLACFFVTTVRSNDFIA